MIELAFQLVGLAAIIAVIVFRGRAFRTEERGSRGRAIINALIMMAVAVILAMKPVYSLIDGALGNHDLTNILLRGCVFGFVLFLGKAIALSFNARNIMEFISDRIGFWVLGVCVGALFASYILGANPNAEIPDRDLAFLLYILSWRLYTVYISVCLLAILLPSAFSPVHKKWVRSGAILISLSCLALIVAASFAVLNFFSRTGVPADYAADYIAVLTMVSGLFTFWLGNRMRKPPGRNKPTEQVEP